MTAVNRGERRRAARGRPGRWATVSADLERELAALKQLMALERPLTVTEDAARVTHLAAVRRLSEEKVALARVRCAGQPGAAVLLTRLDDAVETALGPSSGIAGALADGR